MRVSDSTNNLVTMGKEHLPEVSGSPREQDVGPNAAGNNGVWFGTCSQNSGRIQWTNESHSSLAGSWGKYFYPTPWHPEGTCWTPSPLHHALIVNLGIDNVKPNIVTLSHTTDALSQQPAPHPASAIQGPGTPNWAIPSSRSYNSQILSARSISFSNPMSFPGFLEDLLIWTCLVLLGFLCPTYKHPHPS
jgi:hypothetical protein